MRTLVHEPSSSRAGPGLRAGAWAVHLLTASGAIWALLALLSVHRGAFREALAWLGVALALDGIDGTLARRLRVRTVLPEIDGELLDNVVDYLTYVLVPAFLIHEAALLPRAWSLPAISAICLAAAFQFSHSQAKTPTHFRGFPSCWNVVAFYLLLLRLPPFLALACVVLLSVLSLVPLACAYPSRSIGGLALAGTWFASLVVQLSSYPDHPPWLTYLSLTYVGYYALASLWSTIVLSRADRGRNS